MDEKKYRKNVLQNYVFICVGILALSFLSFLFGEWVLPVCIGICFICGFFVTLLLLKTHSDAVDENDRGRLTVYMLFRYLLMIVGITLSCLTVRFTMGDVINKTRYLMVVIGALPYLANTIAILITKAE